MKPIIMPVMGQDLETGTIAQWVKKENDTVKKGEVILISESEKTSFEVEAEEDGILLKILYPEGAEVQVLKPIAYIGQEGEEFIEDQTDGTTKPETLQPAPVRDVKPSTVDNTTPVKAESFLASPSVKRLAKEMGVDISKVQGSGPDGRILKNDILEATENTSQNIGHETISPDENIG